jgi:L-ascorbate metabolism protein UlaG (beta-lactamase superfamily)
MEIKWLGHSCFSIKEKGKTIITDPYGPELGYSPLKQSADIVTVSHFHPGHSFVRGVDNDPRQITIPGEYEMGGFFITGVSTFHDNENGEIRGKNTVFLLEIGNVMVCHLGDLGHRLTPQLLEEIGPVDVLFLPVGEGSTFSVNLAVETVRAMEPRIVIPMHYKTEALNRELETVDAFLKKMGTKEIEAKPSISLSQSSLPSDTEVVVLGYA